MLEKVDAMLKDLVDSASTEVTKAKQKGYFSKDFAEACGIIISLAYERWRK